jgi:hypothetical protein
MTDDDTFFLFMSFFLSHFPFRAGIFSLLADYSSGTVMSSTGSFFTHTYVLTSILSSTYISLYLLTLLYYITLLYFGRKTKP